MRDVFDREARGNAVGEQPEDEKPRVGILPGADTGDDPDDDKGHLEQVELSEPLREVPPVRVALEKEEDGGEMQEVVLHKQQRRLEIGSPSRGQGYLVIPVEKMAWFSYREDKCRDEEQKKYRQAQYDGPPMSRELFSVYEQQAKARERYEYAGDDIRI